MCENHKPRFSFLQILGRGYEGGDSTTKNQQKKRKIDNQRPEKKVFSFWALSSADSRTLS